MADYTKLSCVLTRRLSNHSFSTNWKAPMRLSVILTVAAFALAGCNSNQRLNPSAQPGSGAGYPLYNPIDYAQTSGFYAGR